MAQNAVAAPSRQEDAVDDQGTVYYRLFDKQILARAIALFLVELPSVFFC